MDYTQQNNHLPPAQSPFGQIPSAAELAALQNNKTRVMSPFSIIGLVAGLVPFILSLHSSSSYAINSEVVHSTHLDYVAVPGGGLALLLAAVAMVAGLRDEAAGKGIRALVALAVAGLGIYQLLRGFGVL